MAASHMIIQNIILMKRYVRHLFVDKKRLCVEYIGGRKIWYTLDTEPTPSDVQSWEEELEDR